MAGASRGRRSPCSEPTAASPGRRPPTRRAVTVSRASSPRRSGTRFAPRRPPPRPAVARRPAISASAAGRRRGTGSAPRTATARSRCRRRGGPPAGSPGRSGGPAPGQGTPPRAASLPARGRGGGWAPAGLVLPAGGAVAGTVTSGLTAVGGVEVHVLDAAGNDLGGGATAADGRYLITGLPPTPTGYAVCFDPSGADPSGPGYLAECRDGVPWDGGLDVPAAAVLVPVTPGQVTSSVDATLRRASGVAGKVTDAAGPVASV